MGDCLRIRVSHLWVIAGQNSTTDRSHAFVVLLNHHDSTKMRSMPERDQDTRLSVNHSDPEADRSLPVLRPTTG